VDLDAYIAEHTVQWRRLEELARRRRLTVPEADELVTLYQRTGTQLSTIRGKTPDPLLLAWLSRVVLSARGAITGSAPPRWRAVGEFFTVRFPLAVYQTRRWSITVGLAFVAAATALGAYIAHSPAMQARLLPPDEVASLQQQFSDYYSQYPAQHFALQVWTNNAWLTAQCLASGITLLVPVYVLFTNMLNVAVDGGFLAASGHTGEFFGLILPRGMLELTAVFVGAGAGLRVGWAWVAPPPGLTRGRSVATAARSAMLVALGLVGVLGVSGLIEAFVTPSPLSTAARIGIGLVAWLLFVGYVTVYGRRATEAAASADLDQQLLAADLPRA